MSPRARATGAHRRRTGGAGRPAAATAAVQRCNENAAPCTDNRAGAERTAVAPRARSEGWARRNAVKTSIIRAVAAAAALALPLAGLSGPARADKERFVFVSHGPDSDSWWNVIKNALKNAGDDMKVTVEYRNPPTGDLADMARIIEQAAASNPSGIMVTIADVDVLEGPITAAIAKGIPVITVNSGTQEQSKKLGALMHVGQPEYVAGKGAGERAKKAGVTKFLCVNHYITNPASVERCQGYADALGVPLADQMVDSGIDPTEVYNKVKAYLTTHPDTNGILTLGPNSAEPTLKLLRDTGETGKYHFIAFDLSPDIAQGIKDGIIESAIDQQPYLQGYLPVVFLTMNARYGVTPGNDVNTGPGFVTKDNIAVVEKFAGEYR
jgi:simple sugar transport system substrate-binding protein